MILVKNRAACMLPESRFAQVEALNAPMTNSKSPIEMKIVPSMVALFSRLGRMQRCHQQCSLRKPAQSLKIISETESKSDSRFGQANFSDILNY